MIDADLAEIYGVTTKRLNEQVKRNKKRFPEDFMFRLTKAGRDEVVAIATTSGNQKEKNRIPSGERNKSAEVCTC